MKEYLLRMPEEIHKTLKYFCFMNDISMAHFIVEAIKEKMEREKIEVR